ncbi:hypothetical protein CBR_g6559 [Chara braunii]|uniref:Uncharacterized protein n=1 Tax=Chara braunii TaxID=69332 RepID=A0A388KK49_CHABU|nr:hypothetical protein CBR_g6559 [Chara braunii]|eukprot:GBG70431.1 hypothetical protein CBR_g6559 [Chara braunii]
MSSRNSSRLSEDGPRKRSSNSVEAVALFPRLHVSHAQNTGPGSGPRAPPRNKMALYEQITLPSKRSFSTLMSSSASMGGSLHGHYNQPTAASPAQGHGVASASQWVWSSHLESPAHHMLHKGDQTSVAMMGKRRQLGSDLFQQGPMPTANASPYYSICTPPIYRPFHPPQAHPHLQPLPFLVPFNGSDGMYHHPIQAPSSANSAVESDLVELQRVPGMPSVPPALAGPVQGIVPSQPARPVMDHGAQKTARQDQGVATGSAAFVSGNKSFSISQPVRKSQEAAGMASGVRYGESRRERTPVAPRGKGAGFKAGTSSTSKRRATREEEDGCVVPSIETPSCRSRGGRTTATSAVGTIATSVSGYAGGVVSNVQQVQRPNVAGQSNELAAGDGPLAVHASGDTSKQTSSRQAAVGTGVGRAWQRLANEQCEGDVRPPGIVPVGIDPAVERMQDSDCTLVKRTNVLPRHMSSSPNRVDMVCSPSEDNYLPLTEDDDEDKTTRVVPTGRISATNAGCSEPTTDVDDRSMDRMEGKVKYSAVQREGNGEEEDPLHKNKKKKRDISADERSGSDDEENSSRSRQLPSAIPWDDDEDDVMGNGVDGDAQNKECCVIMPMDVVKVIGQKGFWDLRKTILRQQRIFSSQVAELHRVVKALQDLAAKREEAGGSSTAGGAPAGEAQGGGGETGTRMGGGEGGRRAGETSEETPKGPTTSESIHTPPLPLQPP